MDAVILSAGLGTRLGEIGKTTPKVLLPHDGQNLLSFHLNNLINVGIERVFINTFHLSWKIEDYLANNHFDIKIHIKKESSLSGTAGGVKLFQSQLKNNFLVIYGDVVGYEFELKSFIDFCKNQQNIATIWAYDSPDRKDKGLIYGEKNQVYEFKEKNTEIPKLSTSKTLINGGLYWLSPDICSYIEPNCVSDFGRDIFPILISRRAKIGYFLSTNQIRDLGTIN